MPPKQPNPTRAWGTRYDTLPTSPPVSPEIDRYREQQAFQDINASPEGSTERSETKLPHDASVFVGRSVSLPALFCVGSKQPATESLPASIDQAELTRLLTDHLSEYAEIKSIKVIRDSKGGVCAFVQCAVRLLLSSVTSRRFIRSPPRTPRLRPPFSKVYRQVPRSHS